MIQRFLGLYDPTGREHVRLGQPPVHREADFDSAVIAFEAPRLTVWVQCLDDAGTPNTALSPADDVWVFLDGCVYGAPTASAAQTSSARILMESYVRGGLDQLDAIEGMFAAVLWDSALQRLVLARDLFGVRALYYTRPDQRGRFAFASDIPLLTAAPGFDETVDPTALYQFLSLSYVLNPRTIFERVRKVRPGCALVAEGCHLREAVWANLPDGLEPLSMVSGRLALDQAIRESVRSMSQPDRTPCAFLSGGTDSSSIVYHLREVTGRQVATFSARVQGNTFDEGPLARASAEWLGTDHHEVWLTADEVRRLPEILRRIGEPFADPSALATSLLCREMGARSPVAMSGDGGDEVLGGYEVYTAARLARYGRLMPRALCRVFLHLLHVRPVSLEQAHWDTKARRFLEGCHLSPLERHALWRTYLDARAVQRLLQTDVARSVDSADRSCVFHDWTSLFESAERKDWLRPLQFLDIRTYLADNNLTRIGHLSTAHGLEVRMPFLHSSVLATAIRLPPSARVSGFRRKVAARQLLRGRLPDAVLRAPRRGFAVPLAEWFLGPLRSWVWDVLAPPRLAALELVRSDVGHVLLAEHESRRVNRSRILWNLVCLVTWHETCRLGRGSV